MNSNNPGQNRILLLILTIAVIGIVTLIIIGITSQGWLTGFVSKSSVAQDSNMVQLTHQFAATLTNCTVIVLAPEYSPKSVNPPSIVIYGSRPFLVDWTVINTSEDCVWSTLQLQTVVDGQLKTLNMMQSYGSQPVSDEEFAIRDMNNLPVKRVEPNKRVTISIQISGLDLIRSNGNIDRSFDMIVNGQFASGGKLIAQQSQWAVLILPSETPIPTFTSTETPTLTLTSTVTPTITVSPTGTPTIKVFPTMRPTVEASATIKPFIEVTPIRKPTLTPTFVVLPTLSPTTIIHSDTPTMALPPIDTPILPDP